MSAKTPTPTRPYSRGYLAGFKAGHAAAIETVTEKFEDFAKALKPVHRVVIRYDTPRRRKARP